MGRKERPGDTSKLEPLNTPLLVLLGNCAMCEQDQERCKFKSPTRTLIDFKEKERRRRRTTLSILTKKETDSIKSCLSLGVRTTPDKAWSSPTLLTKVKEDKKKFSSKRNEETSRAHKHLRKDALGLKLSPQEEEEDRMVL